MSKLAIIDGDSLIYTAAFGCQEIQRKEGGWSRVVPTCTNKEALEHFGALFTEVMERVNPKSYVLYLTDSAPCYRYQVARTKKYKGNRDNSSPPIYYRDIREFVLGKYGGEAEFGEEADDLVSIAARDARGSGNPYVVVGNDKDLNQIPGPHYNWQTGESYDVSEYAARVFLWMQVLMGDAGDNVGGVWKIGFQKAKNRVSKWIDKENLSDDLIYPLVCEEFEKSKKLPGCPYKDRQSEQLANEAYWLVHLKTTKEDVPWLKREQLKIHGGTSYQNENQDTSTSHSAGLVVEPGSSEWTDFGGTRIRTCVLHATDSESSRATDTPRASEPATR